MPHPAAARLAACSCHDQSPLRHGSQASVPTCRCRPPATTSSPSSLEVVGGESPPDPRVELPRPRLSGLDPEGTAAEAAGGLPGLSYPSASQCIARTALRRSRSHSLGESLCTPVPCSIPGSWRVQASGPAQEGWFLKSSQGGTHFMHANAIPVLGLWSRTGARLALDAGSSSFWSPSARTGCDVASEVVLRDPSRSLKVRLEQRVLDRWL